MAELHEKASLGDAEALDESLNSGHHPDDADIDWGSRTALHLASSGGYRLCVVLLLKRGANVNITRYDDATPLHCACEIGNVEIVMLLLNHGANPSAKDR